MRAKPHIDARVLLEAKRLLAHTTLRSAAIGALVGYSHSTACNAFFGQRTAMTVGGFRAVASGRAALEFGVEPR